MSRAIRKLTHVSYRHLIKPVLFRGKPDAVHDGMIWSARRVQHIRPITWLMSGLAYRDEARLGQTIAGIRFCNPIGLSAGLDKNAETIGVMRAVGFGWMTAGSVTAEQCDGNPRPWFYRLKNTRSLVVNAGLANQGAEVIATRIHSYPEHFFHDFPLNVSAAKANSPEVVSDEEGIDDYCTTLARMEAESHISMHEINISCPNTYGGEPFTTPDRLDMLLAAVDGLKLNKPVFIKMPISLEWGEFEQLLKVIDRHAIQGVSIGNLFKDRTVAELHDPLDDTTKGNLSGIPCQAASTELIRRTYAVYRDRFTIIGIGGVFTAEDAYAKIRAGASLVGLVTSLIFEGPQVVGNINEGIAALLIRDGFTNVADAIGADVVY